MTKIHIEQTFESVIESYLLEQHGYIKGSTDDFDRTLALFPDEVITFIQTTQPTEWHYLEKIYKETVVSTVMKDLVRALGSEHEGCLKVLRHGFKCSGKTLHVAYFAPASGLNPTIQERYAANRLMVTRQLHYSTKNENSLDVVISLNGLPLVTAELKNPFTNQTWRDAVKQYKQDRDQNELIFQFKKRTLVHFAVDPDEAYMATRLSGQSTYFLPFNRGYNNGAGNPPNPNGHNTAYLWEQIWSKEVLMDILARYVHLEVEPKVFGNRTVQKETMIFPRYHQLDAVTKLIHAAKAQGAGENYLIQHSAGSGKSNSIAWLAHRLASLHDDEDKKVFDSVVVVTDRRVLDQQLQNTIYQIEHKQGVVVRIKEGGTKSVQLADALESGSPIIITTLQTFPFVSEKIGDLPNRTYAVIVDEAHSSQGGESAAELKGVLGSAATAMQNGGGDAGDRDLDGNGDVPTIDLEDQILTTMLKRGRQPNLSFFAFTATPKYKTLEVFGVPGPDGKPQPFHLYSMRQAIEEHFILDVLKHYTTYQVYYRLIKSIEDDPELDKEKAAKALGRFMSLHPYNISQKTQVMVEHFRGKVLHKIGGRAKAMVVTSSRLHAVRYKQAFDEYINEKSYTDVKTLVAFSGTVNDPDIKGLDYTEVGMNKGIREQELPERFGSDDYQVLLVAEKYQTGFDQPLLHTMYVDKRLAGIQAVQTLSRLNRIHAGKEDTFVLDFVNKPEDILEAFQPYYEQTLIGEQATPGQLYDLQSKLDGKQVYHKQEIDEFALVFFKPQRLHTNQDHARLYACINPAVERFKVLAESDQDDFRKDLVAFRNLYSFLSQIIPFTDTDLEKLYTFIRFLLNKLPRRKTGVIYDLSDDVELKYYRLQKVSERSPELKEGEDSRIDGPTDVGTSKTTDPNLIELSKLIDIINERFGTEFKPADQLFFDSIKEDAVANEVLKEVALANTQENFGYVFLKMLEELFIDRMDQNEEITAKFLNEATFRKTVGQHLLKEVYEQIHGNASASQATTSGQ